MISLILDTNIWIYFAKGDYPEIFEQLIQKHTNEEVQFLVPDILLQEWDRHKTKTLEETKDTIKNQLVGAKALAISLPDIEKKQYLDLLKNFDEVKMLQVAEDRFRIIDDILRNKSISVPVTDQQRIEVSNWALAQQAPFHKKANSTADALILLSCVEYIKENSEARVDGNIQTSDSVFISYNHEDFSKGIKGTDKDIIHPDLEPLLKSVKMRFERHIGKLNIFTKEIQDLLDQFWSEYDEYINGLIEDRGYYEYEIQSGR